VNLGTFIVDSVITVVIGVPLAGVLAFTALRVISDVRQEARFRRQVDSTRHMEIIAGKTYSVYSMKLPVVREKRTGRVGIAMDRGHENEPTTINGETALMPS
jgi:transcriptional regulator of nitric oxide reductase